jgi:hypothetical protein
MDEQRKVTGAHRLSYAASINPLLSLLLEQTIAVMS